MTNLRTETPRVYGDLSETTAAEAPARTQLLTHEEYLAEARKTNSCVPLALVTDIRLKGPHVGLAMRLDYFADGGTTVYEDDRTLGLRETPAEVRRYLAKLAKTGHIRIESDPESPSGRTIHLNWLEAPEYLDSVPTTVPMPPCNCPACAAERGGAL